MAAHLPAARVLAGHESCGGHLVPAQAVHGQLRRRRPGRPGPHHQAQAEEDPVPPPPDRRLPGRDRPDNRALVTTCTTSSTWLVRDEEAAHGHAGKPKIVAQVRLHAATAFGAGTQAAYGL